MKKIIEVKNLTKRFNDLLVIDNISFDIFEGEIICIVGTSGCGKSTLLNILSQLDNNYDGIVKTSISKNDIGYMMQEPALFPWLDIKSNAELACKIKKINNNGYVDNLLKKYSLYEFKNNYPNTLSGGMKQRLSLIRTLSTKPKVLFLDEPFAALDYQTRLAICDDVYKAIKENNITAILVTHDISEAISIADRVIVLSKRPTKIKNTYEIDLTNKSTPLLNYQDEKFPYYHQNIGRDLDIFET